ncbi:Transcriptional adapter ada2, partial [Chytriomyces hyalinus]
AYAFAPPPPQTGFPFKDAAPDNLVMQLETSDSNMFSSLKRRPSQKPSDPNGSGIDTKAGGHSLSREGSIHSKTSRDELRAGLNVSNSGSTQIEIEPFGQANLSPKISEQSLSSSFGKVLTFFGKSDKRQVADNLQPLAKQDHKASGGHRGTDDTDDLIGVVGAAPVPSPSLLSSILSKKPLSNGIRRANSLNEKETSLQQPFASLHSVSEDKLSNSPTSAPSSSSFGFLSSFSNTRQQHHSSIPRQTDSPPNLRSSGIPSPSHNQQQQHQNQQVARQASAIPKPLKLFPTTEEDKATLKRYRITKNQLDSVKIILELYCGTHDWHNYAPLPSSNPAASPSGQKGLPPITGSPQAEPISRYMRITSATCFPPTSHYGMEWVRIQITSPASLLAQSQFRRMMAMLLLISSRAAMAAGEVVSVQSEQVRSGARAVQTRTERNAIESNSRNGASNSSVVKNGTNFPNVRRNGGRRGASKSIAGRNGGRRGVGSGSGQGSGSGSGGEGSGSGDEAVGSSSSGGGVGKQAEGGKRRKTTGGSYVATGAGPKLFPSSWSSTGAASATRMAAEAADTSSAAAAPSPSFAGTRSGGPVGGSGSHSSTADANAAQSEGPGGDASKQVVRPPGSAGENDKLRPLPFELISRELLAEYTSCKQRGDPVTWKKTPVTFANCAGIDLLADDEVEACNVLRVPPVDYLHVKHILLSARDKFETFTKRQAQKWYGIDVNKTGKIFDWFVSKNWLLLPPKGKDAPQAMVAVNAKPARRRR